MSLLHGHPDPAPGAPRPPRRDRAASGLRRPWRAAKRLLRDLSGRSTAQFIALLDRQAQATEEGTRLVRQALTGELDDSGVRRRIADVEHDGDEARSQLIDALQGAITTPIDREDLFRVSRSVDDVLDNLQDFSRELDLYQVSSREGFLPIIDAVIDGVHNQRGAIAVLEHPERITGAALAAKKAANEVRRCYQLELARLFTLELDMEILKQRELLRRLDVVGLRLGEAADAMADGAMKRSA